MSFIVTFGLGGGALVTQGYGEVVATTTEDITPIRRLQGSSSSKLKDNTNIEFTIFAELLSINEKDLKMPEYKTTKFLINEEIQISAGAYKIKNEQIEVMKIEDIQITDIPTIIQDIIYEISEKKEIVIGVLNICNNKLDEPIIEVKKWTTKKKT